jgi:hypothetical protein
VDEALVGVTGNVLDFVAEGDALDIWVGELSGVRATTGCKRAKGADDDEPETWLAGRVGVALLTEDEWCGTSKGGRVIFSASDNVVCSSTLVVRRSNLVHGAVNGLFTLNFTLPTLSRLLAPPLLVPLLLLLTFSEGSGGGKASVVSALCHSSGTQPIIIITIINIIIIIIISQPTECSHNFVRNPNTKHKVDKEKIKNSNNLYQICSGDMYLYKGRSQCQSIKYCISI